MDNFSIGSLNHFSASGRQNSNNNGSSNSQQQQRSSSCYNSGFGSPIVQHSLFGRGVGVTTSNFMNHSTPPNHFNFPLRSNNVANGGGINRVSYPNNTMGNANRGRGNFPVAQSHNNGNKNRSNYASNGSASGSSHSSEPNIASQPIPQYRIFKRGDSIPGFSPLSSTVVTSEEMGNGSSENGTKEGVDGSIGQNKENSDKDGDSSQKKSGNPPNKTPVSQVSEIAKFHALEALYHLVAEKGPPHAPIFTVELHLGPTEKYVGQGSSIKRAQHSAAIEALEKTELTRPTPRSQPKRSFGPGGKRPNWALMQLTVLAEDLKEPISIVQHPITILDPFRRGDPPSVVSIHVGERIFTGEGVSFNAAKNMAAMIALKAMVQVKHEIDLKRLAESANGNDENSLSLENKSPISVVHEMAMKRNFCVKFEVAKEEGPPHNKVFTVVCTLGTENEHVAEGTGPTKQAAKKAASELMITKMSEMPFTGSNVQVNSIKAIQRGLFRQKSPRKKTSAPVVKDLEKQTVSPISRLIQIAHIRKYKEPDFTLVASSANAPQEDPQALKITSLGAIKVLSERERRNIRKKKPSFTMEVSVGPHACRGTGPNKKAAKKAAAEAALIEMGYGEVKSNENAGANDKSTGKSAKNEGGKSGMVKETSSSVAGGGNIISVRQIVPGVIVLNSEIKDSNGSPIKHKPHSTDFSQEMLKVNSLQSSGPVVQESKEKLAYLARLLSVFVSYSDFPKKNEFLSVVSLGTHPPQVAHGCGATLEEAQNMAATKILEELSDMGLDSLNPGDTASP